MNFWDMSRDIRTGSISLSAAEFTTAEADPKNPNTDVGRKA